MFKKTFFVIGMLAIMVFLTSCSFEITNENIEDSYSRSTTEAMKASSSFGRGRNDDLYVALDFLYSSPSINERHGTKFQISEEDIVCHYSEGETFFFSFLFKGRARYSFYVENSIYTLDLEKEYTGVWHVKKIKTGDGSVIDSR